MLGTFKGRYEIKEPLGRGGMGVVYKAYDLTVKRDVAVKTLRGAPSRGALELFQKECQVLASLSHPNIVEIFDIGEYEEEGERKPFFVMPLLPGLPLDKLIRTGDHHLTIARSVEIITQACRGLHAAHEAGLVHRDLKPSNIFVLKDDSVKVIDFGVAHMVDSRSSRGQKGTLMYMAPEQIEMKPLSPLSDIFSLGIVSYETLTRRWPFEGITQNDEIVDAILHQVPKPASEINPAVGQPLSRVIHKAMAKQPWHRFSNARELAETLQKALRDEHIEIFDVGRIQPRIQRARKAYEQGDYQFASEILGELESEGHLDEEINRLRREIGQASRQKTIGQLLESARIRCEEDEYPLALQKIQEVLELDPENAAALGLKRTIENKRKERKIEDWFRLAHQHLSNHAYGPARQALQNVLQLQSNESRALQLLEEVKRREQEFLRVREEKEAAYKAALAAYQNGEISTALSRMEVVLEIERRSPDASDRTNVYQNFYNQVRSEHDAMNSAYVEARKHLADARFGDALSVCDTYLKKYPGHALFQALKFDVEEQQRQELSAYIAAIDQRVKAEPDLNRRVSVLQEARDRYPEEEHFRRLLQLTQDKRDLVNGIVSKARYYEERGQFAEALGQWATLRSIHSQFPALDSEVERVTGRRTEAARLESKRRWIKQVEEPLQAGDYGRALDVLKGAQEEFANDADLAALHKRAEQGLAHAQEVKELLDQGQRLLQEQRQPEAVEVLRKAYGTDEHNLSLRSAVLEMVVEGARTALETDGRSAEPLIQLALEIDPGHAAARSLQELAGDRQRYEAVHRWIAQAQQLRAAGNIGAARAEVERGLAVYPNDLSLSQAYTALTAEMDEAQQREVRERDLEELRRLSRDSESATDPVQIRALTEQAQGVARRHPGDQEFQFLAANVLRHFDTVVAGKAGRKRVAKLPGGEASPVAVSPAPETIGSEPPRGAPGSLEQGEPLPPAPVAADEAVTQTTRKRKGDWRRLIVPAAVLATVAIIVIIISHRPPPPPPPPPPPLTVPLQVTTSPPGASITIDGNDRGPSPFELPEGTYRIEARRDGYQAATASVTLKAGAPISLPLTLQPLAGSVELFTDLKDGKVSYDGQSLGALTHGQFILENTVAPGKHRLSVSTAGAEFTIQFEVAPAAVPVVSGSDLKGTKKLMTLIVKSQGGEAQVECRCKATSVSVDAGSPQPAGRDGFHLTGLTPGRHPLTLQTEDGPIVKQIELGPSPRLAVFLSSNPNLGALLVVANENDARVLLNGKEQSFRTKQVPVRIPGLDPKDYVVKVVKDGYRSDPEQQKVTILKGQEISAYFKLSLIPSTASLTLEGSIPETQVFLDGDPVGKVDAGGGFTLAKVTPGRRKIELKLDGYHSRQFERELLVPPQQRLPDELESTVGIGRDRVGRRGPPRRRGQAGRGAGSGVGPPLHLRCWAQASGRQGAREAGLEVQDRRVSRRDGYP